LLQSDAGSQEITILASGLFMNICLGKDIKILSKRRPQTTDMKKNLNQSPHYFHSFSF